MSILPAVLCSIVVVAIFHIYTASVYRTYQVDSDAVMVDLYSHTVFMGQLTENIYEEVQQIADSNPQLFQNQDYLEELDSRLNERLAMLVVRKNGAYVYVSSGLNKEDLSQMLPAFDMESNFSDMGTYKGGEYQTLVKQLDFTDADGDEYSISVVTSLRQVIPQFRLMLALMLVAVFVVLVIISFILHLWIYRSVVTPLNKLKLAAQNIKNGNLDFAMPDVAPDEIGEVCHDFEEMRVILKQSSEDKIKSDMEEKELIRNISHDLKTPLTAVKGYVEGILDGVASSPEKQEKYLRTIANKVNDMDKLIDELTIYSKLDTNRVLYSFAKINLKDYFDDCCEQIKMDLDAQDIELDYHCYAGNDVLIMADAEQLKRVTNNIVSNSIKYRSKDRKARIGIAVYDEGDYVHIVMSDNGIGIGSSELPRVFERFYRTDSSRNSKQGGSGIGLAIVKKIIEDHKGKIWAESVEGEGTTMHINLLKYKDNTCYCLEDKNTGLSIGGKINRALK
jgi:signal transduction histidine kinase